MKRGVGPCHLPLEAYHATETTEMPRFCVVSRCMKVFLSVSLRLICGRFRADLVNMAGSRRLSSHLGSALHEKGSPEGLPVLPFPVVLVSSAPFFLPVYEDERPDRQDDEDRGVCVVVHSRVCLSCLRMILVYVITSPRMSSWRLRCTMCIRV